MDLRCIEDRRCENGESAKAELQDREPTKLPSIADQQASVLLSKRQQEILAAACLGMADKVIADNLGVSPRTLEGHWRAIHRKLGSVNRCQAGFIFAGVREKRG